MSDPEAPRNRRERRAAAKQSNSPVAVPTSTPKIKLAQPDRSSPKVKTMMDLYEERKALLNAGQPFDTKYENLDIYDEGGNILEAGLGDGEPIGVLGQAIFWAVTLGMLHFTLDVLVYNQYRQEVEWSPIFKRTGTVLPILFLAIWMLRSPTACRFESARQVLFLVIAVASGCYMMYVGNKYDYYAVMKQAPPVGTLWVWSVIEMKLTFAVASVVIDLGYLYWKGFSAF